MSRALALLALLLAGCANPSTIVERSTIAVSEAILQAKRGCGFLDLEGRVLEGRVLRSRRHPDGDRSFDILPDPDYAHLLQPWPEHPPVRPYVHVEFMPRELSWRDVRGQVEAAIAACQPDSRHACTRPVRVRVSGRWAWDGVDHRGDQLEEIRTCAKGREPDPTIGWPEIHPAQWIEILPDVPADVP